MNRKSIVSFEHARIEHLHINIKVTVPQRTVIWCCVLEIL